MKHKHVVKACLAILIVLVGVSGVFVARVFAGQADGLTLTILSDDTSVAAGDTSDTNGQIPVTGGQITYRWLTGMECKYKNARGQR